MRYTRLGGTMIGCAALLVAGMVPAHASPPATFTLDDVVGLFADDADEMAAFVNTSRDAYCTADMVAAENAFLAWLEAGAVGDPPEFPVALGALPMAASAKDVGTGNVRFAFRGPVPIELWTFEEGKSAAAGNLIGPCIDTDGILDGTATLVAPGELFASGEGTWTVKDNDAEGAGPRSNVWGDRIAATLSGPGGDYSYAILFKNHVVRGEYSRSASFTLRSR